MFPRPAFPQGARVSGSPYAKEEGMYSRIRAVMARALFCSRLHNNGTARLKLPPTAVSWRTGPWSRRRSAWQRLAAYAAGSKCRCRCEAGRGGFPGLVRCHGKICNIIIVVSTKRRHDLWPKGKGDTYVPVTDWSSLRSLPLSSSSALTRSKRRRMEIRD